MIVPRDKYCNLIVEFRHGEHGGHRVNDGFAGTFSVISLSSVVNRSFAEQLDIIGNDTCAASG